MPRGARSLFPLLVAAALATTLTAAHAQSDAAPDWTETKGLLSASRVWISPGRAEGLRTQPVETHEVRVDWTAAVDLEDGTTQAERASLLDATALALMAPGTRPQVRPEAGAAAPPAARDETSVRYRIEARITEVWRPYRLVNVVLAVLPWPLAPLFSQGGAATEMTLVDTADDTLPIARFECRRHAGVLQFYNAFWRVAHTRAALTDCAREFHAALRRAPVSPDAAPLAGAPARGPLGSIAVVDASAY
jgi:hypothetical protein